MNYNIYFKKSIFLVFLTVFLTAFAFAQPAKTAVFRQDTLLNGLKVLVWSDPTAEKVTIKLRIHSGAAFDPMDKMGVMALLSEILFPTDQARAFFTEDLEGSLEITSNYDFIQINATGKSSEILAMLETISNAIINPQITPENLELVKAAHLKKVQKLNQNPMYSADLAVAQRLFGTFPYGRSSEGTVDSLTKIDHADLLFAKQRFLTSDNAVIAIIGNVKFDYALRATRQLFGGWVKADKKVPATFAMPNEPDVNPQVIDLTHIDAQLNGTREVRFASRGVARKNADYFAMRFLADILENRFQGKISKNPKVNVSVVHERNLLPGLISFKFSFKPTTGSSENSGANGEIKTLPASAVKSEINPLVWLKEPITATEFEQTRTKILAEIEQKSIVDKMFDIDTFKLVSVNDEMKKLNSVTLADVQRVAEKLSNQPFAQVILNYSANQP